MADITITVIIITDTTITQKVIHPEAALILVLGFRQCVKMVGVLLAVSLEGRSLAPLLMDWEPPSERASVLPSEPLSDPMPVPTDMTMTMTMVMDHPIAAPAMTMAIVVADRREECTFDENPV